MPVADRGGGGGGLGDTFSPPPQRGRECPKNNFVRYTYGNGLVEVQGGLGCFNGPHDGYANRSDSQTSLPHAIGRPTDSRTVLLRAVC